MNRRLSAWVAIPAIAVAALSCLGCEQGPAERAGEKIDRAMDRLSGKGPAEKAGERIDNAVKELKK